MRLVTPACSRVAAGRAERATAGAGGARQRGCGAAGGGRGAPGAGSGPGREGGQNSKNSSKPPLSNGLAKPAPKVAAGEVRAEARPAQGQPGATMQLSQFPTGWCGTSPRPVPGALRAQGLTAPSGSSLEDSANLSSLLHFVGCSPPRACHASATTQVQAPVVHHERRVVAGSL